MANRLEELLGKGLLGYRKELETLEMALKESDWRTRLMLVHAAKSGTEYQLPSRDGYFHERLNSALKKVHQIRCECGDLVFEDIAFAMETVGQVTEVVCSPEEAGVAFQAVGKRLHLSWPGTRIAICDARRKLADQEVQALLADPRFCKLCRRKHERRQFHQEQGTGRTATLLRRLAHSRLRRLFFENTGAPEEPLLNERRLAQEILEELVPVWRDENPTRAEVLVLFQKAFETALLDHAESLQLAVFWPLRHLWGWGVRDEQVLPEEAWDLTMTGVGREE